MEQYQGKDINPALWFYVPLSRASVLGLVEAASVDGMTIAHDGVAVGAARGLLADHRVQARTAMCVLLVLLSACSGSQRDDAPFEDVGGCSVTVSPAQGSPTTQPCEAPAK